MTRERVLFIVHIVDTALKLEPDYEGTVVELACQYGKSANITPAEVNEVWDMTVGAIFGTPTERMISDESDSTD